MALDLSMFKDISDEKYRVYEFPDGSKVQLTEPIRVLKSDSGGHRVLTADGVAHYIPAGWHHLWWVVKENHPPFAF